MTLAEYVEAYILERELSCDYARQLRATVRNLSGFLGAPAGLDIDAPSVNRYLISIAEQRAPKTVRNVRMILVGLLTRAADDGLREHLGRVRIPRVPQRVPEGWTREQLRTLLAQIKAPCWRRYDVETGMPRGLLLEAVVRVAWDSGARIGDVLRFTWQNLRDDGTLCWSQAKTGRAKYARLSPSTMDCLQRLHAGHEEPELIPWRHRRENFFRWFRRAVRDAGLTGGTRKIRRGSASYVEREHPGTAWRHLGHAAPGLDRAAYIDPAIAYGAPEPPPEL